MGWSRRQNVPDQDPDASGDNPLAGNMRLNRSRRSTPTEPLDSDRTGSIFDQQTVVDTNFSGRSEARKQRQPGTPFTTQQLSTWAADPNNSRKLMTFGGVALGILLLIALFSLYNRTDGSPTAEDTAGPFASEEAAPGGLILNADPQPSAAPDLGTAPQPVPNVPNSDPAQQPAAAAPTGAFVVTGTATEGLFLRSDHVVDPANILGTLPEGTRIQDLGQEFDDGTRKWRQVRSDQFGEGWVAADFVQPAP